MRLAHLDSRGGSTFAKHIILDDVDRLMCKIWDMMTFFVFVQGGVL